MNWQFTRRKADYLINVLIDVQAYLYPLVDINLKNLITTTDGKCVEK